MVLRTAVASAVAVLAVVGRTATGSAAVGSCGENIPQGPAGLPSPVVLTTSCGQYELDKTGGARFLGQPQLPVPADSVWFPADLTWYRFDKGHLLIGRGQQMLWRSHHSFSGRYVDGIALSANRVAFSLTAGRKTTLYVAGIHGFERAVARGESPLAWTAASRLLTSPLQGGVIRLRGPRGHLQRTVARGVWTAVVDASSHRLYVVARGVLSTFGGSRLLPIANLASVGLGRRPVLSPLGDVVGVSDGRRLVVFRSDGSQLSSTGLPRRRARADWAPGGIAAAPDGTIAFTATSGNTAYGSSGTDTVYLLRAGATAAVPLYSQHVEFAVCERMSGLAWRGSWLLYSASEGYAAAIDTGGRAAPVDLSPLGRRLPGFGDPEGATFEASWSRTSSS